MKFNISFKEKPNYKKLIVLFIITLLLISLVFIEVYSPLFINKYEDLDIKSEVDRVGVDFYKDKGDEMYYADYKNNDAKDTILFIHGMYENSFAWRKIIPGLTQKYHVISFDLLGFGLSKNTKSKDIGLDRSEQIIKNFIEEKKYSNITIVADGEGGQIAEHLGIDEPNKVISIVLINSYDGSKEIDCYSQYSFLKNLTSFPLIKNPVYFNLLSNIRNRVKDSFYDKTIIDKLTYEGYEKGYRYKGSSDQFINFMQSSKPKTLDLSKIKQLVLIYSSDNDEIINKTIESDLSHEISNSHLLVIPKSGHLLMEEQPSMIIEGIGKWIEEAHNKIFSA